MKKVFCLILCLFVIISCIGCSPNNFFNITEETITDLVEELAQSRIKEILMPCDMTINKTVNVDGVILNLNGHTLTTSETIFLRNGGTITNGTIIMNANYEKARAIVVTGAPSSIKNITLKVSAPGNADGIQVTRKVNIENVDVIVTTKASNADIIGIRCFVAGEVIIKNSNIKTATPYG